MIATILLYHRDVMGARLFIVASIWMNIELCWWINIIPDLLSAFQWPSSHTSWVMSHENPKYLYLFVLKLSNKSSNGFPTISALLAPSVRSPSHIKYHSLISIQHKSIVQLIQIHTKLMSWKPNSTLSQCTQTWCHNNIWSIFENGI